MDCATLASWDTISPIPIPIAAIATANEVVLTWGSMVAMSTTVPTSSITRPARTIVRADHRLVSLEAPIAVTSIAIETGSIWTPVLNAS